MDRFANRFLQERTHNAGAIEEAPKAENISTEAGAGALSLARWHPHVDVSENDKSIVLHAELPGCSRDDIKLSVENSRLVLQGEKRTKKQEKGDNWVRRERVEGTFYRSMQLPRGVDGSQVQANYKDGVLEVVIPKPEDTTPKRQLIDIRTSDQPEAKGQTQ